MAGDDDLRITSRLLVPPSELSWRFSPSGGPGGQHANTSNTRAEVTFDIEASAVLSDHQRALLMNRLGRRVVVSADDTRSQARNRQLALDRLAERLRNGLRTKTKRKPTKPKRGAVERRLEEKKRRSRRKADRGRRYHREG